jgi:hypothetical protein
VNLRWLVLCDSKGNKTDPALQWWDEEVGLWRDIEWVECKTWDEYTYNHTPPGRDA